MKVPDTNLFTPIYLKLTPDMPWPEHEKVFYVFSRDGLFLCRNHPFFHSCVQTNEWPAELAAHEPMLRLNFPKIPARMFETIIGFFARIGHLHGAEAAVLLAWNTATKAIEVIVPDQTSIVSGGWSKQPYPIEVHYQIPPLPPHLMLIGDIHSHVDEAAYASSMDKQDEAHRPGLHIVAGRISKEPPELHIDVTVDGARFKVNNPALVLEGYEQRRMDEVPTDWETKVTVKSWSSDYDNSAGKSYGNTKDTAAIGRLP